MSEHERQTAFLREVTNCNQTAEIHTLNEDITRLHGQIRVLRQAVFWMMVLTALAVASLGYAAILSWDYPDNMWRFFRQVGVKVPCALGVASLMSLLYFTGLGVAYRKQMREKARRLAARPFPGLP